MQSQGFKSHSLVLQPAEHTGTRTGLAPQKWHTLDDPPSVILTYSGPHRPSFHNGSPSGKDTSPSPRPPSLTFLFPKACPVVGFEGRLLTLNPKTLLSKCSPLPREGSRVSEPQDLDAPRPAEQQQPHLKHTHSARRYTGQLSLQQWLQQLSSQ